MFANALARKYGPQGVVSTSLNPGELPLELLIMYSARSLITSFRRH